MRSRWRLVANRWQSIRITYNSMCLAVMGSERKSEADSENLVADSVVRYRVLAIGDGQLAMGDSARWAMSGWRRK